jgi:hypothetical protein
MGYLVCSLHAQRSLRVVQMQTDTRLLICLLRYVCRSRPLPEFWKLVSPRATARKLFVKFTRLKVRT